MSMAIESRPCGRFFGQHYRLRRHFKILRADPLSQTVPAESANRELLTDGQPSLKAVE